MNTILLTQARWAHHANSQGQRYGITLFRCTCPCLDCIEGAHCGRVYQDDETGALIGECHEVVDERPADDYWPEDWDDE